MSELTMVRRSRRAPAAGAALARGRLGPAARLAVLGFALAAAPAALAYVGPGAGLGILGVAAAVLAAIGMGFFALVMWPIRKLAQQRKAHAREPREHVADRSDRSDRRDATQRRGTERR